MYGAGPELAETNQEPEIYVPSGEIIGFPVLVQSTTWGAIKLLYR